MRESIGATQLFAIVIVLLLLFTAFLCLSINYTAAYKVSDAVVNVIKRENGVKADSIKKVMSEAHYTSTGDCTKDNGKDVTGEWTAIDQSGNLTNNVNNAYMCLQKYKVSKENMPDMYYYKIKVFYKIDVPIISSFNLNSQINTPTLYSTEDDISINVVNEG